MQQGDSALATRYIHPLERLPRRRGIGKKAQGLRRLQVMGLRIPRTFVLIEDAYSRYLLDDNSLIDAVAADIDRKLDLTLSYAVRSSANLEDSFNHSFAGQFKTALNVRGREQLLQAIWSVWAATSTPQIDAYLQKHKIAENQLRMAVILQEMVKPVVSGVAFSRNPLTGARSTIIEAVEGEGTRLVQEGVTPYRWVFQAGACMVRPETSPLPETVVETLAQSTRQIARRCKQDLDLEWAYDGKHVYWLQMRPMTAIDSLPVYSNRLAREMIGGMVKPLIWSINIPMVNSAWIRLLTEVIGPNDLDPLKLAKSFHYRTYFNMGLLGSVFESLGNPAESLEMMWGLAPNDGKKMRMRPGFRMLRVIPKAIPFLWEKWTLLRRLPRRLAALEDAYRGIDPAHIMNLTPSQLVAGVERLLAVNSQAAYDNIVIPLSMYLYNAILRNQLHKIGADPARLDMQQGDAKFDDFNPARRLNALHQAYLAMPADLQELLRSARYDDIMAEPAFGKFREDLADFLARFGHLSDHGNDFSNTSWRENRDLVLQMIASYQPRPESSGLNRLQVDDLRLPFGQGWMFRRLYRRACQFIYYREQISYLYTYGYSLFRPHFLALGCDFQRRDWIDAAEDIFYLDWKTVRRTVETGQPDGDLRAMAAGHKQAMQRASSANLPQVIYGDDPPPIALPEMRSLRGTPTARGYCTGRVKVVNGIQDFGKVADGDVLVIPYSDVGWTPLFARASGVIAEAGGMLSHSSIIAREYGIPAVVSVPYATNIPDGMLVSIDGYQGEILLHPEEQENGRS